MQARSITKALLAETGVSLELVQGDGYWYFIVDVSDADGKCILYETHSVMTMRLNWMTFEQWMDEGRGFIAQLRKEERL